MAAVAMAVGATAAATGVAMVVATALPLGMGVGTLPRHPQLPPAPLLASTPRCSSGAWDQVSGRSTRPPHAHATHATRAPRNTPSRTLSQRTTHTLRLVALHIVVAEVSPFRLIRLCAHACTWYLAEIDEGTLRSVCEPFGPLSHLKIPPGKGCAFVQYMYPQHAEQAILALAGHQVGAGQAGCAGGMVWCGVGWCPSPAPHYSSSCAKAQPPPPPPLRVNEAPHSPTPPVPL